MEELKFKSTEELKQMESEEIKDYVKTIDGYLKLLKYSFCDGHIDDFDKESKSLIKNFVQKWKK